MSHIKKFENFDSNNADKRLQFKAANILIAKFMGAEHKISTQKSASYGDPYKESPPKFKGYVEEEREDLIFISHPTGDINASKRYDALSLKYHSSFDWLIPVVQKINSLDKSVFANTPVYSSVDVVYSAAVDYIQTQSDVVS